MLAAEERVTGSPSLYGIGTIPPGPRWAVRIIGIHLSAQWRLSRNLCCKQLPYEPIIGDGYRHLGSLFLSENSIPDNTSSGFIALPGLLSDSAEDHLIVFLDIEYGYPTGLLSQRWGFCRTSPEKAADNQRKGYPRVWPITQSSSPS